MRLLDGRGLNTPPFGIRMKWLSRKYTPLYFLFPIWNVRWPFHKWRARKSNNRFKAATSSEKNFRTGLLPWEIKDVGRTAFETIKSWQKVGNWLNIFVRKCHYLTTNLLLGYQLVEIWSSKLSIVENQFKEQPVMAKQMVKNIQFDLLEKRKEIDYLGRFLNQCRKLCLWLVDWIANQGIELIWKPF